MSRFSEYTALLSLFTLTSLPAVDNPPPGIPVPDSIRMELEKGVNELGQTIETLHTTLADDPKLRDLIPDVVIFYNAVRYALIHDQFYRNEKPSEFEIAADFLEKGKRRAAALQNGNAPWTHQTGLVVRGYISNIDDSVQPYGLEIPETYDFDSPQSHRLDVWYHGRGNTLSEIKFLHDRENQLGKFQSPDTIVLHPYGRYCNANKFAGETDTFEAIDSTLKRYRIDDKRIAVRGFSMGGAATWHMATHHASRWAAAAPGAGFAETAIYANVMNKSPVPAWYELKLHSLYDATQYAGNLFHCPTIAYSGSEDKQKQAADIMSEYMKKEGLDLLHIVGEGMGHKYDDASIQIINDQVQTWARTPIDPYPKEIRFTTHTLRYNQMHWLTVDGLEEHWKRSDVTAKVIDETRIHVQTRHITGFTLTLSPELVRIETVSPLSISIDGRAFEITTPRSQTPFPVSFSKIGGTWDLHNQTQPFQLAKRHGLQGPIDDAFMDRFLFVMPTGQGASKKLDAWVDRQRNEAVLQWWRQFRGEALVKDDVSVTQDDIENCHLVLWGDPTSNQILRRIQSKLPFEWKGKSFKIGAQTYSTDERAPVLIYPNPLNPSRYIVINSGFTFSAFSGGSNSLQIPKLPDWAILDLNAPPESKYPVGVVNTGFFDESWQLQ